MLSEKEILSIKEHRKDLHREAQQMRLARQAQRGNVARRSLRGRALAWLGGRLIAWGTQLQARYGLASTAPRVQVETT